MPGEDYIMVAIFSIVGGCLLWLQVVQMVLIKISFLCRFELPEPSEFGFSNVNYSLIYENVG